MHYKMHNHDAVAALETARRGEPTRLGFVSPVSATMIAAATLHDSRVAQHLDLDPRAHRYAANLGLLDVLQDRYQSPTPGGRQGLTYTKLIKLATHAEVESCNAVINDLITAQLAGYSEAIASLLSKVIGELHDNVASHARGAGFSAAQVYHDGTRKRVEFAITDAGCGMLRNVQRLNPQMNRHIDAIEWCMKRGNTTAKPDDFLAQRLPEDACWNPYPAETPTTHMQDHHVGEGLFKLSELIRTTSGRLWAATGNGVFRCDGKQPITEESTFDWQGVAIELEITVSPGSSLSPNQERNLDELARRLGL